MEEGEIPIPEIPETERRSSTAIRLIELRRRVLPLLLLLCVLGGLAGIPFGCGGTADALDGRWRLATVDDTPVSDLPPTRLDDSSTDPRRDWIEEELVSRSIEISDRDEAFVDRRVIRRTHVFPPGSIRRSDAPPTRRIEGVDTVVVAGTLEFSGDTIRFDPEAGSGEVLTGTRATRNRDRLRLTTPDGTLLTFERTDDT